MPGSGSLIHPRFRNALAKHFPKTCTIQEATETRTDSGAVVPTWSNLAGHVDLTAALDMVTASERRNPWGTYAEASHVIALLGHYPNITNDHRAVVEGTNYDILGVEHDALSQLTYLPVRRVTP